MRRYVWPLAIFLLAVIAWSSIVFLIPALSALVLKISGKCASEDIVACKDILSAFGATGDLFGAVTSLFSGLALFAVAFTLWADANAKRDARKPFVVTYLTEDSVVLDDPSSPEKAALTLSILANVSNKTGEAALNVSIDCQVSVSGTRQCAVTAHLKQPLVSGGSEEATFKLRLEGEVVQSILSSLTADNSVVEFAVSTYYDSLESISWSTKAVYEVRCKVGERRRRLNALRSGTEDFAELWKNSAAVPLDVEIRGGSWRHERVQGVR
jgi:hypothetical protein